MHKLLWDYDIQTDHLISARQPGQVIVNKKRDLPKRTFCCPGSPLNKIKKWKPWYKSRLCLRTKKANEFEGDGNTSCNWCTWNNLQGLLEGLEYLKIRGQMETIHPTAIMRIGQNTEKDLEDLKRLDVVHIPMKYHQVTLVRKHLKSKMMKI